ncbi:MAG TPA: tRNA (adenosine(37)-N6)-threonylcarbamoyltransferase complex ATPase subunit type 1 TsaE [Vicinamibacterales bacterium]|nr:tRNA (adenosine(37)-N6)-threonylcarbamoyltransferase complex ATPase subunit type 1 TsaE [Vicinamibacterales bacterium]
MSRHLSGSEADTAAIGRALGAGLAAGDVVLLRGPLGAGKTAFVRGLAEGLGCDPDAVTSPTFTIVQEYRGRVPLQHVDLYRLTPVEVDDLALDDLAEGAVMAIEWADRWSRPPAGAVEVTLNPTGDTTREIAIDRGAEPEPKF